MAAAEHWADDYLEAVVRADRHAAQQTVDAALADGCAILDIYQLVLTPTLIELGRRWQIGELTVAEEHIATAITQRQMARLFAVTEVAPPSGRSGLVATITKESHCIGARMVADCFELHGWDVTYVGTSIPVADLVACVERTRPDMVALSMTLPMHVAILQETIAAIRAVRPKQPILLGGQGCRALTADAVPRMARLLRVPDLAGLAAILTELNGHEGELSAFPEHAAAAAGPDAAPEVDQASSASLLMPFVTQVTALTPVRATTLAALEEAHPVLVAHVDQALLLRTDLSALVGTAGVDRMRENHENHALFIESWLRSPLPGALVECIVWAVQTYRSHGFSLAYWTVQLDTWQQAHRVLLTEAQADELRPLYQWMSSAAPELARMLPPN